MKQHWFVGILSVLFLLLFAGSTQSQVDPAVNPFIFRIKLEECAHAPHSRRQSGFLVAGRVGVVTALHGLVDCPTISAVSSDGKTILRNMVLHSTDIDHDSATLWSPDLDLENLAGLRPSTLFAKGDRAGNLSIVGHPFGLERQERLLIESDLALEKFNDLIPLDNTYVGFISRESPSIDSDVLRFSTLLQPGLAGAPILDEQDQLVAVASGGLRIDDEIQSWALFWEDIALQRHDEDSARAAYQQLAALDLEATFGFSTAFPQQLSSPQQLVYATIRLVDAAGNAIEQAEVTLSYAEGYAIGYTDADGYLVLRLDRDFGFGQSILLVETESYGAVRYTTFNPLENVAVQTVRLVPATPTATPTVTSIPTLATISTPRAIAIPTPSSLFADTRCHFAYTIVEASTYLPIERARVRTTVGARSETGYTDTLGFYRGELPCADPANATATVRVSKTNYQSNTQRFLLQGESKEIILLPLATPTMMPTATRRATPTRAPTTAPTPCGWQINPYALNARQRADVACPAQDWVPSRSVEIQQFAGGFMLVFDGPYHSNFQRATEVYKTYLLANDGRAWRVYFDSEELRQFTSPDPDEWYTCEPQAGLRPSESGVPWRRFGLIWCSYPQIRDAFGRALTDEIATTASFQSYYRGRVFQITGEDAVYIVYLDATDETIEDLYLTGTWELGGSTGSPARTAIPTARRTENTLLQPTVEIVCNDTKGQVWFTGTVTRSGKPLDGYYVHFKSTKVGGDTPVATVITGRSDQHSDWAPGYFEQFVDVYAPTASAKSLHIWVTNPNGRRVSENVEWETDGGSGKCNKAIVNFAAP